MSTDIQPILAKRTLGIVLHFRPIKYALLRRFMQRLLYALLSIGLPLSTFSQVCFTDIPATDVGKVAERVGRFRALKVDLSALRHTLSAAPPNTASRRTAEPGAALTLPLPDGSQKRFRIAASSLIPPDLQAKYPDIRCYTGVGIDDPTASLKCELTPRGFYAMILSGQHGPVFIDPLRPGEPEIAIAYFKADLKAKTDWTCSLGEPVSDTDRFSDLAPEWNGDCQLRRYRLALACTGEYAQFHGGTKALVLSAMATTINRVNGIYERDLGIQMVLVPNNDTLIFLDPATDGYSNNNPTAMLSQNVATCNALIGAANYDIGHVFGTAGGGLAGLGVVCNNNTKARGVTGRSQPVGDAFDVDYVAHEIGHQFGANHTQNNNCSRNSATSVEPGSGSTIMGYAGICSPNVQNNSDDYFHAISIQEIRRYTVQGLGNTCPQKISLDNTPPSVSIVGPVAPVIPRSTPFVLEAAGSDAEGTTLSYCWEQMNNQAAPMPPQATNTAGPLFRSLKPTLSTERYFPALEQLLTNATSTWERLPAVGRDMRFRVTVRDNHPGGGCTAHAETNISVDSSSGPFRVLEPNEPTVWYVGKTATVRWDVAGTDASPVNCTDVLLLLSTDGGRTYPHVLAGPTPNTGEAQITVPPLTSDSCRLRVQAVGNIFFDISDTPFRIEVPPAPSFALQTSLSSREQRCAGDSLVFWAKTLSVSDYAGAVQFTLVGLPADADVAIEPNPALIGDSVQVRVPLLPTPGLYGLTLLAQSDTIERGLSVQLQVVAQAPPAPVLYAPPSGRRSTTPNSALSWQPTSDALHHRVQVSTSPDFSAAHLVWETLTADTVAVPQGLLPATVYYWRVRAENACGQGAFSPFRAFQTAQTTCSFAFDSQEVPVPISDGAPSTIFSSLTLAETRPIADLDVQLKVRHSWVGDLRARLIGPDGTAVLLFDQPGAPLLSASGCSGEDADLLLDDEAAQTAEDLEKTCQSPPPALSGSFRPVEFLAIFDNRPALGSWRLELSDLQEEDGGALESWGLRGCLWDTLEAAILLRNETLVLPVGQTAPVDSSLLTIDLQPSTPPEDGLFILLEPPQHGWLLYDGAPIGTGAVFSQADLNAGRVAYKHTGDGSNADAFFFDGLVTPTGQWLHHARFSIRIVQNDLVAALEILDSLRCHNGNDARLLASAQGGRPPYAYRLIGSADILQDDGLFDNIGPGTYSVVVTDRWGFTAVSPPLIVPNPGPMVVNAISVLDSISVEVSGGTAPYRYRIGDGAYRSEPFFSGLPNGTYTVEVQDAFGCIASAEVIVYVGPLAVLAVQVTPPSCFDAADGAVQVIAGGGVPPYRYNLNGEDFQTENTFLNLPSGEYTLTLLDKNDSTLTHTFHIEAPPPLQVSATVVLNRIEVAASGGTGPLHYRLDEGDYRPEPTFEGLANGTYLVTVRDANGCTAQTTATVEVPPLRLLSVSVEGTIRCANETVLLSAEATGGVPPYRYALDGGPFQANGTWEGVGAGPHVVVVRDAAGTQVGSDTFFIDAPPPLSVQATTVGPHAYLTPIGGTPPYQYSLDGFTWTSDSSFLRLLNGAYSAVVRDANGCTNTAYFDIFYFPLSALIRRTPPRCAGYSDGALEIDIVGGVPPFTCNGQTLPDNRCSQTGLSAGTYPLVLTDALGDTLLLSIALDDPPALVVSAYALYDTLIANATGGTGALFYSLDGLAFQASPVFAGLPNGIYTVIARDANGCTATSAPVTIDIVSTSIPDASAAVRAYPNPTAGRLWVQLDRYSAQTLHLYLYGPQGALLQQHTYSTNTAEPLTIEMNLHPLPPGLYLLFGTDGRQTFRKSIIVLPKD